MYHTVTHTHIRILIPRPLLDALAFSRNHTPFVMYYKKKVERYFPRGLGLLGWEYSWPFRSLRAISHVPVCDRETF
jgi:hypothetical protein